MATELKRTDSMLSPQLFHFDDHFEFEEIIGRSTMSEVGRRCWRPVCLDMQTDGQGPPQIDVVGHSGHPALPVQVFRVRHKISGEPFAVKRSRRKFASRAHRRRC